jgi:hypothetical protein
MELGARALQTKGCGRGEIVEIDRLRDASVPIRMQLSASLVEFPVS